MASIDVRDWNERIRRFADRVPDNAETKFGFICQCGCGTLVALTWRSFDANGAWVDDHEPDAGLELEAAPVAS